MTAELDVGAPAEGSVEALAGAYTVEKSFPGVHAVRGVTLELRGGQVHCLVGENGAGKSTLVKMFAGVYRPDAGEIRIGGKTGEITSPNEALNRGISTIFQELTLVSDLTVAENLFLGREPSVGRIGLRRAQRHRRAEALLAELGISDIDPRQRIRDLGVAHQQMVEIAKALSLEDERVLIMDEPTSTLTGNEIQRLFELVERLKKRGLAILYITHRLEELEMIGDVVTVMRDGAVVMRARVGEVSHRQLIEAMIGRKYADLYPRRNNSPGDVVLEVTGASVPGKVRDASLTLRRSEIVGLFGLVGSGRTELVRALIGADRLSAGEVVLRGKRGQIRSPRQALGAGIGFVPEDRKRHGIVPELSVATNIGLSSLRKLSSWIYLPGGRLRRHAMVYVRSLDIRTPSVRQSMRLLSGGNQQKAIIARALSARPDVIILDEPTRGVDVGARMELYQLINTLCTEGKAVLMVTSDISEALGMSDRILVMRNGTIVRDIPSSVADERTVIEAAFGEPHHEDELPALRRSDAVDRAGN